MVTRRGFTAAIGALGSVGAAYWFVAEEPPENVRELVNESQDAAEGAISGEPKDPWDQSFNSGIVDRIQFDEDGTMSVTFAANHGLDSFGVWHVSDEWDEREPIYQLSTGWGGKEMPRYSGTVSVNIGGALRNVDANFPSNRFKLVGLARGPLRWDHEGQVKFHVPEPLMP